MVPMERIYLCIFSKKSVLITTFNTQNCALILIFHFKELELKWCIYTFASSLNSHIRYIWSIYTTPVPCRKLVYILTQKKTNISKKNTINIHCLYATFIRPFSLPKQFATYLKMEIKDNIQNYSLKQQSCSQVI